jgi:phosphoribosylanthranilate isomerase
MRDDANAVPPVPDLRKAAIRLVAMAPPLLKICGLREPDQAAAVAALGVDAVGVIGVPSSPRWLEPARRAALFDAVASARRDCLRVLVVADPAEEEIPQLEPGPGGHNVVQLHGNETVERCLELRRSLPEGLLFWKALRIREPGDLLQMHQFSPVVDALLIDAWVSSQLGGTGHQIPLEWLREFRCKQPWWLAGGINPERMASLQGAVNPNGFDASSGVEDAPGVKNLARVEALVQAVRNHQPHPGEAGAEDAQ